MHVTIHTLRNGEDTLAGVLHLQDGRVVAEPADSPLLQNILAEPVYDWESRGVFFVDDGAEEFLRALHMQYRSAYLRASEVVEDVGRVTKSILKGLVERKDKLGRRLCYDDEGGGRLKCPPKGSSEPKEEPGAKAEGGGTNAPNAPKTPWQKTKQEKQPKEPKSKAAAKPKPPTVDEMHNAIVQARQNGLTPEDLKNTAALLTSMTVKDITEVKKRLGVKASGAKAELVKKIIERATAATGEKPKPQMPAEKPVAKPAEQKPTLDARVTLEGLEAEKLRWSKEATQLNEKIDSFFGTGKKLSNKDRKILDELRKQRNEAVRKSEEAPRKAVETVQKFLDEHPTLQALKSQMSVRDLEHPLVQRNVLQLAQMPTAVAEQLAKNGLREVAIANANVPDLDGNGYLKGVRPRGHREGRTWDTTPGCYNNEKYTVSAGVGPSGSVSLALHETGHAVGDLLGFDHSDELVKHHERLFHKLSPYQQQDGPGGFAGRQEMFAEGFAFVIMNRERAVQVYDEDFVAWVENKVLKTK